MADIKQWVHPKWTIKKVANGYRVESRNGMIGVGITYPTIAEALKAASTNHKINFTKTKTNDNATND